MVKEGQKVALLNEDLATSSGGDVSVAVVYHGTATIEYGASSVYDGIANVSSSVDRLEGVFYKPVVSMVDQSQVPNNTEIAEATSPSSENTQPVIWYMMQFDFTQSRVSLELKMDNITNDVDVEFIVVRYDLGAGV